SNRDWPFPFPTFKTHDSSFTILQDSAFGRLALQPPPAGFEEIHKRKWVDSREEDAAAAVITVIRTTPHRPAPKFGLIRFPSQHLPIREHLAISESAASAENPLRL